MLKKPTFKLIGLYRSYFNYPISFSKGIFMNIASIQRVNTTYRNEFNSLFAEPGAVLFGNNLSESGAEYMVPFDIKVYSVGY